MKILWFLASRFVVGALTLSLIPLAIYMLGAETFLAIVIGIMLVCVCLGIGLMIMGDDR